MAELGRRGFLPLPDKKNERGRQLDLDAQRYRWGYKILTVFDGRTRREIAKLFEVSEDTVKDGLEDFDKRMPIEAQVPKPYRPLVAAFRAPRSIKDPKRFLYARGSVDPAFHLPGIRH